jgi:hypothetical protein
MTTGRCALARLPGVLVRVLSATLSGVIANKSTTPRTNPATETESLPALAVIPNSEIGTAPVAQRRLHLRDRTALQDILVFTTD